MQAFDFFWGGGIHLGSCGLSVTSSQGNSTLIHLHYVDPVRDGVAENIYDVLAKQSQRGFSAKSLICLVQIHSLGSPLKRVLK